MENDKKDLNTRKNIMIIMLVLIGFIITVDLAYIYYEANFNQYALPSFCSVSDFVDCDGVARTTESQFFGVPLAYWGMFLYFFILMLFRCRQVKKYSRTKILRSIQKQIPLYCIIRFDFIYNFHDFIMRKFIWNSQIMRNVCTDLCNKLMYRSGCSNRS